MYNVYYTHRTWWPENRLTHSATRVYRPIRLRRMYTKYLRIKRSAEKKKTRYIKRLLK